MKTRQTSYCKLALVAIFLFTFCIASFARQDSTRFPLILNFYSIGTGTPGDQPLKDFIVKYRKQNKIKPLVAVKVGGLGREGEYAILFPLTELNAKQKKQFVAAVSKALPSLKSKEENGGINADLNQSFDMNRARTKPEQVTL